jgi:ADP-heptose:LPS heptosyltransferase
MERKKILVIRFSSIGDIVLTTPVLRCLHKVPGLQAEVHVATKKAFAALLQANPHVGRVHALEGSLTDLIRRLRAERFDYVVDLHNNLRSNLVRLALGRPSRAFHKLNIRKWLLTRFRIDRLPRVHIVDRYMEAAAGLGVKNDSGGLEYHIPQEARHFPDIVPGAFRDRYTAFVIGGKHATKRLPAARISAICQELDGPVVLLGGPEDGPVAGLVAGDCGDKVFDACGKLSLDQSAYLVQQATVVITHDTGLMHVAAAFRKPIVSIWGNTIPAFGMFPYMPGNPELSAMVEVEGLSCRPCSKIGFDHCPKGHFDCMEKIPAARVAALVRRYSETDSGA